MASIEHRLYALRPGRRPREDVRLLLRGRSDAGDRGRAERRSGLGDELADQRIGYYVEPVKRCRNVDVRGKSVVGDREAAVVHADGRDVALTNLRKVFFPATGATKGDLLQYYADVAPFLVPYMAGRAQVMKRYPNGAAGDFFYMKRTPSNAPPWLRTCAIEHGSGSVIAFPVVDDLASLLWLVNLGCIDLNEWYARCDDSDSPDYLHFDLDPVKGGETTFATVRQVALAVREGLDDLGITPYAKTSGSAGIHIYVPIERGPLQKAAWTFAKVFAQPR